jgi:hypothetical protein
MLPAVSRQRQSRQRLTAVLVLNIVATRIASDIGGPALARAPTGFGAPWVPAGGVVHRFDLVSLPQDQASSDRRRQ